MRRSLILAVVLALVALSAAAGCAVPGTATTLTAKVATADGVLANKYASAWWSEKFGGGKHNAALLASVQSTVGMDVVALSSTQKATDLGRLSTARQTVSTLQADKVLSQADANKVLAAITDIETAINKQ